MNKLLVKVAALLWMFRRSQFYRDMADAVSRKVGIRDFLDRELSNAKLLGDNIGALILKTLAFRYASGNGGNLRDLLVGIAPRSDLMLLSAVDDAGDTKAASLEKAAEAVDFQTRSMKVLMINLATPAVAVPIVGAICLITSDIIASIAADSPPSIWIGFNGFVRELAEFINNYWVGVLVGLFAVTAMLVYLSSRWIGKVRLKFDGLPGFSLYRDYNAAVVLSAMAMMIGSGKTMMQSLVDLRMNATPWLRWQLQRVINSLEDNPTDYMSAFSKGLMPVTVRARLASLLDSSNSFDAALVALGTKEVTRLETSVRLSAQTVNWTFTGILVSLAVVLSIGQMTIASALSSQADPTRMIQR